MYVTLTVVRYPVWLGWVGFFSMALFRLPLLLNRKIAFWKLMGCGKNGTFDKTPDVRQWAILVVHEKQANNANDISPESKHFETAHYGAAIAWWWKFFNCEKWSIVLEPIEGHGTWDGKKVFGELARNSAYEGPVAVLTRATIHLNKLNAFWDNVDGVARLMAGSPGFVTSLGIGEVPWIKQATFSIWQSKTGMKAFAYKMREHAEVIKKTHQEKWYKEDMFTRFKIISAGGTLRGANPLQDML